MVEAQKRLETKINFFKKRKNITNYGESTKEARN